MDADGIRELAKSIADKLDELPNVLSDLNRSFGELDNALKTLKDRLPLGEQKKALLNVVCWRLGKSTFARR